MGLDWGLYDLNGGFLGSVDKRRVGSRVEPAMRGRYRALLQMSLDDPLSDEIEPLARVIRVWMDGAPIFGGVIGEPTLDGAAGTAEVPALGPSLRLERAFIDQRADAAPLAGAPVGQPYTQTLQPEGEIMWRLVSYASPTAAELTAGVPDHGIVRGNVVAGANITREFKPGDQVMKSVDDVSDRRDGLDFDFRPVFDRASPEVLAELDTFTRMGEDKMDAVRLEFNAGDNTASNLILKPSGDIRNRLTGIGEAPPYEFGAPEATPPPEITRNQVESQIAIGHHSDYQAFSGVTTTSELTERVAEIVAVGAFPIEHFDVVPALMDGTGFVPDPDRPGSVMRMRGFGKPPRFGPKGEWWLGDSFRAIGQLGRRYVDLAGRVLGATLEEADEAGNVMVVVHSAPRITGVEVT